jgi:hypothetical protein
MTEAEKKRLKEIETTFENNPVLIGIEMGLEFPWFTLIGIVVLAVAVYGLLR